MSFNVIPYLETNANRFQYPSSNITMSFMKLFGFNVRSETVALFYGSLVGAAIGLPVGRRRQLHMQDVLARQRQQYEAREARAEINRIDHALCQKWAGKVDPEYWK